MHHVRRRFDSRAKFGLSERGNNQSPIKVSTTPKQIEVLAEIAFIPLEGRVDAKSARQSVRALQPRQVVILGGGKPPRMGDNDNNDQLVGEATLLADAVPGRVYCPSDGNTIKLKVGHAAYSVRLIDNAYTPRQSQNADTDDGDANDNDGDDNNDDVIEAYEAKMGECTVSVLDYVATGQKVAADGSIVLAPKKRCSKNDIRQQNVMISDGEVLLTDLRSEISAQGMKVEYR